MNLLNSEVIEIMKNEIFNILNINDIASLMQTAKLMRNICYLHIKNRNNANDHLYCYNKYCIPLYLKMYKITPEIYQSNNKDGLDKHKEGDWSIFFEYNEFDYLYINSYIMIKLILEKYKDFVSMNEKYFNEHASDHGSQRRTQDCVSTYLGYNYLVTYKIIEHNRQTQFIKFRGYGEYGRCYWGCGNINIKY